ncbi:MAG TPA: hypothetical protein VG013_32845 [Gemmataceae bacterium]|nr:hypothetical protein [Gemmataceae bacterium]
MKRLWQKLWGKRRRSKTARCKSDSAPITLVSEPYQGQLTTSNVLQWAGGGLVEASWMNPANWELGNAPSTPQWAVFGNALRAETDLPETGAH